MKDQVIKSKNVCEPVVMTNKNDNIRKFTIKDNIVIGEEIPIPKEAVNVGEMLLRTLKSKPDCIGQVDALTGKISTYTDMSERSIKCALWLKKQGAKSSDIIGLCTDNNLDAIVPMLATLYVGAVCCTWDHKLSLITAKYFLSLISPTIVFTISLSVESLAEAAKELNMDIKIVVIDQLDGYESLEDVLKGHDVHEITEFKCAKISNPDKTAFIVLSSGTTGLPKATEISHFSTSFITHPSLFDSLKGHVCTWASTFRWQCAIVLAIKTIVTYSTRIVVPDYDDDEAFCQFIEKYQISWLHADTCMLIRFSKTDLLDKYRLPSMKKIISVGAHFKKEHHEALAKRLPHVHIANSYGLTDVGRGCTEQIENSKLGSIGFVLANVQIKITDINTEKTLGVNQIGELYIKTPTLMIGYYKNSEATKQAIDPDGWLRSGDIGFYDDDGEFFIVDRRSEFINFKCINVSPAEIEAVLGTHPAVLEAAVIGIPDEIDEQHPMAVVRRMPNKTVTEEELVKFVEENMPDHCQLRGGVKFLDDFPRTSTRKIAKKDLRKIFIK